MMMTIEVIFNGKLTLKFQFFPEQVLIQNKETGLIVGWLYNWPNQTDLLEQVWNNLIPRTEYPDTQLIFCGWLLNMINSWRP